MSVDNHRRRKRKKKEDLELWGSLYGDDSSAETTLPHRDEEDTAIDLPVRKRRFNVWKFAASLMMFCVLAFIGFMVALTWIPQDLSDVQGYDSHGSVTDLPAVFRRAAANGEEAVFTEAEINRYLQDTLKLSQDGVFNLIARPYGVAVRIHNGYVELIMDRLIGSQFHQTISVYLTFREVRTDEGVKIEVEYRGGDNILGSMPRGGRIGLVSVPERYILILHPAVEGIKRTYVGLFSEITAAGYLPRFVKDENGGDNCLILQPSA